MKHKALILKACQEIKSRRQNKLGVSLGLCEAIYLAIPEDIKFNDIRGVLEPVMQSNKWDKVDFTDYIDTPGKWTPKRRLLLDQIIKYLSDQLTEEIK